MAELISTTEETITVQVKIALSGHIMDMEESIPISSECSW